MAHRKFVDLPNLKMVMFHINLYFPMVFPFSHGFPIFPWFSYCFPMIFPFSHGFPMVFPFSYGFPMIFPFSRGFPMVFQRVITIFSTGGGRLTRGGLQQFFCHGHLVTAERQEDGQHLQDECLNKASSMGGTKK